MRRKLNLGFLAILLLLWAICVHTLLSSKGVQGILTDLQEDIVPGAIAIIRMEYKAVEIRNWTFTYAMRGNVIREGKTIKEWLQQQWAALEVDAREHLEHQRQVIEGEQQVAQAIVDLSQKLVSVSAEVIDLKDQGAGEDELLEKIRKEFGSVLFPLIKVLNEHAAAHLNELSWAETKAHNQHKANIRYVITFGLAATFLALSIGLLVDRLFVRYTTERKRAEEELRLLSQAVNSSVDGIAMGDLDDRITYVNEAFTGMFGYSREELIGKEIASLYAEDQIPKLEKAIKATIEGGWTGELVARRKDGQLFPIAVSASRVVNDEGKVVAQMASHHDITERKRAEEELRKLSAAVIQSANMIVITDTEGVIEYVNPQFSRLTGYSLAEAVGKPISILKSGKQDEEFYNELWQAITSGKNWTGKLQNRRKNGETYWERKTITAIFDESNRIINFLSVGEDITTEIITQQKLVETDKMSAVGMLAAGVAHEFKNYLAGIVGNASFALTELEEEGGLQLAHETLSKIVEYGEKANDVAMSLLSYSKAKPEEVNQEDLKKIIGKTVSLVEKEMKNLSIEIVTYFEEVPEVEVSTSKIQQLLLNLLINAQHAIKSNGVITVALLAEGNYVRIKVGDTGVGIPQENLGKIFDPFFSTKGVWGKDELVGTGMGLAICRNIAREHGGDLTFESIVGAGTTFTLTLPVSRNDETALVELLRKEQELKVLIFTLDKSIVSHYFKQACEINARMMLIDNITKLPDELLQAADLVICDAKFTGKVELYKMVETCRRLQVPYVMVNCGATEYQLADLFESSSASFKQLPNFSRIISSAVTRRPSEVSS
jgi:PAS domain S-box-containing protein